MSSYSWKTPQNTSDPDRYHARSKEALESGTQKATATERDSSNKKRRKVKKAKEEKEEGELDDDNEDNNSQENYDDYEDFDDYDFDEDSKHSQQSSNSKKIDSKEAVDNVITAPEPVGLAVGQLIQQPAVASSFTITNPYDIEYEDYDSDDDDYGNNKRLKIDEREDLPDLPAKITTDNQNNPISTSEMNAKTNSKEIKLGVPKKVEELGKQQIVYGINKPSNNNVDMTGKTNLGLDNNENSSSSISSSKSGSSTLTAISAVSTDSLTISTNSANSESSCQNNPEIKEVNKKEAAVSRLPVIEETRPLTDSTETKSLEKQTPSIDETKEDSMKVPALKIIISNSSGSLPYVKTTPKTDSTKLGKTSKKEASIDNNENTPIKQQANETIDSAQNTASSIRSKLPRQTRVASPISTNYKTTPTRRSAAAAAAAALNTTGRASPLNGTNKEVKKDLSLALGNEKITISNEQDSSSSSNSNSSTSNLVLNNINSLAVGSIIGEIGGLENNTGRRKLRSHTRLGVDDLPETNGNKVKLGAMVKSPLPLAGINEFGGEVVGAGLNNVIGQVQMMEGCELSNGSSSEVVEKMTSVVSTTTESVASTTTTTSLIGSSSGGGVGGGISLNDFMPTRKKRNRQQQQQLQEQLDLINEIDSLNASIAASLSHPDNNKHDSQTNNGLAGNNTHPNDTSLDESDPNAPPTQPPILFNCIKKFVDLRQDVIKRREALMQSKIDVQLPKNFNDFIIHRKSYLIKSNKEAQKLIPFFKPPNDIPDDLKVFFGKQEKERYSLRLRHRVEQDKLVILYEQEVLRCFNKSAREAVNQEIPFSFCSMIKDDEIYSMFRISEQASLSATTQPPILCNTEVVTTDRMEQQNNRASQSSEIVESVAEAVQIETVSAEEVFSNELHGLRCKFQKLKDDCIKRQLNESDSLHAVQKMNFQAKLRELSNKYKNAITNSTNSITKDSDMAANSLSSYNIIAHFQQNDIHVPIVHVNNKFDLLDASQQKFTSNLSNPVPIYA